MALSKYGIEDSRKEAETIMTECLGLERVALYRDDPLLSPFQVDTLRKVVERRGRREPIQYIIGHVNFLGLILEVGPGVLIPRPETELVVEEVIKTVRSLQSKVISQQNPGQSDTARRMKILDLCTGSGCLAIALAKAFPRAEVVGTDISETALGYATQNARRNSIGNVTFLKGNLFEPLQGMRFDVVVTNPPYIREAEIRGLQREICEWEPREALEGGSDGLRFYREILLSIGRYMKEGGFMVMEVGDGEAGDVASIAKLLGFENLSIHKDYSAVERIIHIAF